MGEQAPGGAPSPATSSSPPPASTTSPAPGPLLRMGRVVHFLPSPAGGHCLLAHVAGVVDQEHEIVELAVWRRGSWDAAPWSPHDQVEGGWHWPAECPRGE